jgi:hypothetical protein
MVHGVGNVVKAFRVLSGPADKRLLAAGGA